MVVVVSKTTDGRSPIVAPGVRPLDVLAAQLEEWLTPRIERPRRPFRVEGLRYPQGAGQSYETILFDVVWEEAGRQRSDGYVVRIKPTSFRVFNDDLFLQEYAVMRLLGAQGRVPVACPRWIETEPALLGAPFFVMDQRAGRVPVSFPSYMESGWVVDEPVSRRARLWENGVRTLAAIAGTPLETVEFLSCPQDGPSGSAQEWTRWLRFHDRITRELELPRHRDMWAELERTRPETSASGLAWGDARLGNLMFDDDLEVVAVMDWEQPSIAGPLQDLAWWLFNDRMKITERGGTVLEGLGDHADTVSLWREASGLDIADLAWYEAFAGYKMVLLTANMIRMRGQRPPGGDFMNVPNVAEVRTLLDQL